MKTNTRKFHWLLGALALASVGATAQDAPRPDATDESRQAAPAALMPADAEGRYSYMIEFTEPELLRHPSRQAGQSINLQSPAMQAARSELKSIQASRVSEMTSRLGRSVEPTHHYLATENGIAVRLTQEEARIIAGLEGVKSIERARMYRLDTFRGPEFMGADTIWDGTNVPDGSPLLGEGMIAAVLDSGIPDPNNHDSFANVTSCGHGGANPDKVLSALDCSSTDGDGLCNGGSPFDTDGHGSHTASTVAGNTVDSGSTPAPNLPAGFSELSGVAPCAHIRSYKVCPGQSCPGPDIAAGLESVLIQGEDAGGLGHADVMNYSISGGTSPWSDFDRDKLDIVDAGVFIAASAGNTSPTVTDPVGQVNHRGPWVMSVAASTRDGESSAVLVADGTDMQVDQGSASPAGSTLTDFPITYDPNQPSGSEGCSAFPTDFFDGTIALIQRGSCPFADKINNAAAAGAEMVVIWNNESGLFGMLTTGQDPSTPAYSLSQANGQTLINLIDSGGGTALVDFNVSPVPGDVLADFSFRGPTPAPLEDLQKPNITAPGVDILAAVPGGYGRISGTSMSSPHVAGAAVLVRQAHPGWTVSEVKSALQMTAERTGTKEDQVTPWDWDDVGSGRADLTGAALAGLVMDETVANYLAANPSTGGDVKTLNLPSMRNLSCTTDCTWQRTVRNTLDTPSDWTVTTASTNPDLDIQVSPSNFSFSGGTGETQTLTITAAPQADLTSVIAFGEVVMSEDADQAPDAHMTVAISGTDVAPQNIEIVPSSISTTLDIGAQSSEQLDISNTGDLDLTWSIEYSQSAASLRGGTSVLWDQPTDGTSGIVSDVLETASQGDIPVYSANDFVLAPPQQIESIFTPGFWNSGDVSTANTISWYVYADDGGQPAGEPGDGNAVWSYSAAPGSTGVTISDNNITLDVVAATGSPITLPETGRYWLIVAPSITTPDNPSSWWNWSQGIAREGTNHLYDPTDFFGAGATSWTPQTDLGVAWPDSAFTLSGTLDCAGTPPAWLSLSAESGTIPGGDATQVTLDFDATGLQVGDYEAFLCLSSNDPDNPQQFVPVNMTVTDPFEIFSDRFEQ